MRAFLVLALSFPLYLSAPAVAEGQALQRQNAIPQSQRIDGPKITANSDLLVTSCRDEKAIAGHFRNAERAISLAKDPQTSEEMRIKSLQTARTHLRAIEVASVCPEGLSSSVEKKVDDTKNAVIGKVG